MPIKVQSNLPAIKVLESENISYELSADGLAFQVNEKDYANASIVLGTNDIPTSGTKLSDVFDGGFSSTEADKTKKYKLYLEEYYAGSADCPSQSMKHSFNCKCSSDSPSLKTEQFSVFRWAK